MVYKKNLKLPASIKLKELVAIDEGLR